MSMPNNMWAENIENNIILEWIKPTANDLDTLSIAFYGDQQIYIEAGYPLMDIKVSNYFPLNEDMANFVTTHLNNFKQPLKKKRYK